MSHYQQSCTNCGDILEPGDAFCENCGQKTAVVASAPPAVHMQHSQIICQNCNQAAQDDDVFCYFCGQKLLNTGGAAPRAAATVPPAAPAAPAAIPGGYAPQPHQRSSAGYPPPQTAPTPMSTPTGYTPTPQAQPVSRPRMPLIFLLDTSASTAPHISQLNTSINRFKSEVSQDRQTQDILDVAMIQFDDNINVLQGLTPVGKMKPVRLIGSGNARYSAPIQEALRMVDDYLYAQTNAYKPWIVLISGSRPNDDISAVAGTIQNMQQAEKLRFIALGTGSCDNAVLKRLTDIVFRLDGTDFASFFDWISRSMWAIAQTSPGDKPQLPTLQGNVYRDK